MIVLRKTLWIKASFVGFQLGHIHLKTTLLVAIIPFFLESRISSEEYIRQLALIILCRIHVEGLSLTYFVLLPPLWSQPVLIQLPVHWLHFDQYLPGSVPFPPRSINRSQVAPEENLPVGADTYGAVELGKVGDVWVRGAGFGVINIDVVAWVPCFVHLCPQDSILRYWFGSIFLFLAVALVTAWRLLKVALSLGIRERDGSRYEQRHLETAVSCLVFHSLNSC